MSALRPDTSCAQAAVGLAPAAPFAPDHAGGASSGSSSRNGGAWRSFPARVVDQAWGKFIGAAAPLPPLEYATQRQSWGSAPQYILICCAALLLVAIGFAAGRSEASWAAPAYWSGVFILIGATTLLATSPAATRHERIICVIGIGLALYAIKVLHSPINFTHFDEFLHWATANGILAEHHLFTPNNLLPVSTLYPGLEIVTTALVNLSGLSVFAAGVILVGLFRLVFLCAMFLFFERVSGSERVAALGLLIYMGSSDFALFQSQFAYESAAFTFLALVLLAEAATGDSRAPRHTWLLAIPFLAALAVTHHLTAYFAALMLVTLAVLEVCAPNSAQRRLQVVTLAGLAVLFSLGWTALMGNPIAGYLGPVLDDGFHELFRIITQPSSSRRLFVAEDGTGLALWQRYVSLLALALVCLGLLTGFVRTLRLCGARALDPRLWTGPSSLLASDNSRMFALALIVLGFPLSLLLRLTRSGWEMGNRLGAFVFIGVGIVAALSIALYWQGQSRSRLRAIGAAAAIGIVLLGGFVLQWELNAIPSKYRVAADAASVESLGIDTANWTRRWLGGGRQFASDRINRGLLATFGGQNVVTTLSSMQDASSVFFGRALASNELQVIKNGPVDYLLVDMRLSTGLPAMGVYFEGGEDAAIHSTRPEAAALMKFDKLSNVGRLYDNGVLIIYDVSKLRD